MQGGTIDKIIAGNETDPYTEPINGGIVLEGSATNTAEGDLKLDAALSEEVVVAEAGPRTLGPYDCTGLTGFSCCLMIKHIVRDSDQSGRSIQCFLEYAEGTAKRTYMDFKTSKKVLIFSNHYGLVKRQPKIVGNWNLAQSNSVNAPTT